FSHLVDEDFILDKRVIGGMQQVSIRMAEALGDDVFLNAPVRTVKWNESGATVLADGDIRVEASRVILAVPPNLYSRISYDPPLPRRQH
ncbi:FAD-dependent oxidoreductase, partial [Klebsiella variicola]